MWHNLAPAGEIFIKFECVFRQAVERTEVSSKSDGIITGTWHENLRTFMIISCRILLRTRNVSDNVVQKVKTHCMFNFQKLCHLWDNVEKCDTARQATDGNIIWNMCFVCWITQATDLHSEYVIHIAYPQQQWLHERTSVSIHTHCLPC